MLSAFLLLFTCMALGAGPSVPTPGCEKKFGDLAAVKIKRPAVVAVTITDPQFQTLAPELIDGYKRATLSTGEPAVAAIFKDGNTHSTLFQRWEELGIGPKLLGDIDAQNLGRSDLKKHRGLALEQFNSITAEDLADPTTAPTLLHEIEALQNKMLESGVASIEPSFARTADGRLVAIPFSGRYRDLNAVKKTANYLVDLPGEIKSGDVQYIFGKGFAELPEPIRAEAKAVQDRITARTIEKISTDPESDKMLSPEQWVALGQGTDPETGLLDLNKVKNFKQSFPPKTWAYGLKKGQPVDLRLPWEAKARRLTYLGTEIPGNEERLLSPREMLRFRDENTAGEYTISMADIDILNKDIAKPEKKSGPLALVLKAPFRLAFENLGNGIEGAKRIIAGTIPRRVLASAPGLTIVSRGVKVSKKSADEMINAMKAADEAGARFGYDHAPSTEIAIHKGSPSFLIVPQPRLLQGGYRDIIFAGNVKYKDKLVPFSEASVLTHERFHNILIGHYGLNAYTSKSSITQEALADFAAALTLDDPRIAHIRNLGPRPISKTAANFSAFDQLTFGAGLEHHAISLALSRLLWDVKEKIGAQKASALLKVFTDDLNRYHLSYVLKDPQRKTGGILEPTLQETLSDLHYFAAVLLKTTAGSPDENIVRLALNKYLFDFKIDPQEITAIADSLKARELNPADKLTGKFIAIQADLYGASTLMAAGTGAYWAVHHYLTPTSPSTDAPPSP